MSKPIRVRSATRREDVLTAYLPAVGACLLHVRDIDVFIACAGADRRPGRGVNGVRDEMDGAVGEEDVDAAGVEAARGGNQLPPIVAVVIHAPAR